LGAYTPRQAVSLAQALLHGGYFVRRQYTAYAGGSHGLATVRFLERLITRQHARPLPFGRQGRVHHICARPLYDACGLVGRRWGREASSARVVESVTTLDFVLAQRDAVFVVTDADKVRLLAHADLGRAGWPIARRRRGPDSGTEADNAAFDHRAWFVERDDSRLWLLPGATPEPRADATRGRSGFERARAANRRVLQSAIDLPFDHGARRGQGFPRYARRLRRP